MDALALLGGGLLLYFGAEWLVGGAAGLARRLNIAPLLIGLTVVAYGTSAPEIVVGVSAARAGTPGIAIGNVLGSNLANFGLVLGLVAIFHPPRVDVAIAARDIRVLVAITAFAIACLAFGRIGFGVGVALVAIALAHSAYSIWWSRKHPSKVTAEDVASIETAATDAGAPTPAGADSHPLRLGVVAAVGLATLIAGGHIFVGAAANLARFAGMSEQLVGLTVVAIGTSVPELATSLLAAKRGHASLAIGNVVGSNIFNLTLCLGTSAIARPLDLPWAVVRTDALATLSVTVVAAVFLRSERTVTRLEGAVLLVCYVAALTTSAVLAP